MEDELDHYDPLIARFPLVCLVSSELSQKIWLWGHLWNLGMGPRTLRITRALFSSTKSRIYDKEKLEKVKVILFYKLAMDSNTFLFEPIVPKIGHMPSRPGSSCVYVRTSIRPVSMVHKDQKIVPNQYFWSYSFENNVRAGNTLRRSVLLLSQYQQKRAKNIPKATS